MPDGVGEGVPIVRPGYFGGLAGEGEGGGKIGVVVGETAFSGAFGWGGGGGGW